MSEEFRNKLQKRFDNDADDAFNYLAELTPEANTVVRYRDDKQSSDWSYAVIMSVDIYYYESEWDFKVFFADKYGQVHGYTFDLHDNGDMDNLDDMGLFGDYDENIQVVKKCTDIIEAFQLLKDIDREGLEVLKEI